MNTKNVVKRLFLLVALLGLISLACNSTAVSTPTASSGGQGQVAATNTAKSSGPAVPTNTPRPTSTPEPTSTPTPIPVGMSRSNPYAGSEKVSVPNWDVQVLEMKRGQEAWDALRAANMFNEPAPSGFEYLIVKLHVKSTYTDNDEHSIGNCDFDITGDRFILYTCSMNYVVAPDPRLDSQLYSGGEAEGWVAHLVSQGEGNLILVVDETMNFDDETARYIALDEGAAVGIPAELSAIDPTIAGQDRGSPASRLDQIITEDWEISVKDVVRGDEAWNLIQQANKYNDPPAEGMEYIDVKIHIRYIATEEKMENIGYGSFKSTGSANVLYDEPIMIGFEPSLDVTLFPGGEYEGWVVLQSAKGETGLVLVFNPLFDYSGVNKRFISLEQ